jgi:hypothetical protein
VRGIRDRLALLVAALVSGAALFGWMIFADRGLGLTREQHFFVGGALVYSVSALYFLQQQILRHSHDPVKKGLAVVAVESPIVLFLLLFSSGTVPWPKSMLPYVAGTVVIAPVMIIGVNLLFRRRT